MESQDLQRAIRFRLLKLLDRPRPSEGRTATVQYVRYAWIRLGLVAGAARFVTSIDTVRAAACVALDHFGYRLVG